VVELITPKPPADVGTSPGNKPTLEIGVVAVCPGPGAQADMLLPGPGKFGVLEML
jgi:hypothetical protein